MERSEHRLSEAGSPGLHAGEEVVTVYSKPGCSGCEEVKSKLRNAQIPFEEKDGLSPSLLAELRCAGKVYDICDLVLPIVQVDSKFFLYDELDSLFRELGFE